VFGHAILRAAGPPRRVRRLRTHAQFDAGQISGFIRDAQQGALPGATVTLTNEATHNK